MCTAIECQKDWEVRGMFGFLVAVFLMVLLVIILGALFWWGIPFVVVGLGLALLLWYLVRRRRLS